MNTTMKTLSALTIAAAALAATVLPSSALPNGPVGTYLGNDGRHGLPAQPLKLLPSASRLEGIYGHGITCLVCDIRHLPPGGPGPVTWPHHGDHGWNHWYGWDHGYGWRDRPEIIVEG
jgi:hypothetical protein